MNDSKIEELGQNIRSVYNKFRIHFYMQIFSKFENREATLTTVESYSMECIMALGEPTIAEFAKMLGISAPNAAYRVNSLITKGYIDKIQSKEDQREYHIKPTKKFLDYYNVNIEYLNTVVDRCKDRFAPEDFEKFSEMLKIVSDELMPELDLDRFKNKKS